MHRLGPWSPTLSRIIPYQGPNPFALQLTRLTILLVGRRRTYKTNRKDVATALKVGRRHGKPAVLRISSGQMHQEGHEFYLSENGVWLTNTCRRDSSSR